MMRWILALLAITLLLAACTTEPTAPEQADEPIKIGFITPLTGDASNVGQSAKAAATLAQQEINDAGGINGRQLELIIEDGKCNGKEASSAASKLINFDQVPLIIGGICSSETMSFADMAEQSGTVVLSYCSSNPAITDMGDYIFRNYPSDSFGGSFMASYMYDQGYREVAVFSCLSDYCKGLRDVFVDTFTELGGEIVSEETHEQSAADLRSQLTKLRSADPEALYFLSYQEEDIRVLQQMQELGWDIPVFGADTFDDPKIPETVGSFANRVQYNVVSSAYGDEFKNKMTALTGSQDITVCTPQAYDAVYIVANLLREGKMTADDLKEGLYMMAPFEGVSGSNAFDENGDLAEAEYVVKTYEDGQIITVA